MTAFPPCDPLFLAYTAGIIDGEGCLSIVANQPVLVVVNRHWLMLERLRMAFGGSIYPMTNGTCRGWNARPCYQWRLGGPALRQLLRELDALALLIIKEEQAQIILMWADAPWHARETLVERIHVLNQRGMVPKPRTGVNLR
jgi:hypothetical protein